MARFEVISNERPGAATFRGSQSTQAAELLVNGESGDHDLERAYVEHMIENFRLFQQRHRKYGRGNISRAADLGIVVRLGDKLSRLENLYFSGSAEANDETIVDTIRDIHVYANMLLMVLGGQWPNATPKKGVNSGR